MRLHILAFIYILILTFRPFPCLKSSLLPVDFPTEILHALLALHPVGATGNVRKSRLSIVTGIEIEVV